jgi:hypothetical protein
VPKCVESVQQRWLYESGCAAPALSISLKSGISVPVLCSQDDGTLLYHAQSSLSTYWWMTGRDCMPIVQSKVRAYFQLSTGEYSAPWRAMASASHYVRTSRRCAAQTCHRSSANTLIAAREKSLALSARPALAHQSCMLGTGGGFCLES